MEITINVNLNAPDLVKSIQSLAAALAVSQSIQPATFAPPTPKPEVTTKKKNTKEDVSPNTVSQEQEAPPKTETPQTEATETPTTPTTPTTQITLEEVRAKLAQLSQSGKQAQVKELITKFGATKLTEIPAEKYADLLVEAEAIA